MQPSLNGRVASRLERRAETTTYLVDDLLAELRDGKLRMPHFQRGMKWHDKDRIDLFDSLYRGFPIGTLLFWKHQVGAGEVRFGDLKFEANGRPDGLLIVDGQQRVTTLASALLVSRAMGDRTILFDLEKEAFHYARIRDAATPLLPGLSPPSNDIPVHELFDSSRLIQWVARRTRDLRSAYIERALDCGKRLREYRVPVYIVDTKDEAVKTSASSSLRPVRFVRSKVISLRRSNRPTNPLRFPWSACPAVSRSLVSACSTGTQSSRRCAPFASYPSTKTSRRASSGRMSRRRWHAPKQRSRALFISSGKMREFRIWLGEDLPGALLVRPVEEGRSDEPADSVTVPADHTPQGPLRFSLAGMQLKFSVAQQAEKLTLPVTGVGGRFILKMPSRELANVPANELSMMTWARESGISVPPVKLVRWRDVEGLPADLDFKEEDALLVTRFDRPLAGGPRVHQEDFAQVLGKRPTDKYGREAQVTFDRLGKIIAQICGEADFVEFVRRLVFVVLSANPDAHLKNWSLIYPDGRRPRLAPAYDLVSTADHAHITTELAHRLAGEWELGRVRDWHFGMLASRAGFDAQRGVNWAREYAQQARETWKRLNSELPLSTGQRTAVEKHLATTKLP